ncbi:MAG: YkgJ family cysteine cluster protein [Candidatus Tyrphobacter sp.]
METIDLIALRDFAKRTGQPTHPELLDVRPMEHVSKIEIDEEHVTIEYNEKTTRYYNLNEITKREWIYKYNDDREFVAAVANVIALARKHLKDVPDNISCPPGCAECCSGYEPFVTEADVSRIAEHLGKPYDAVMREYVVPRRSADGHYVGWLRKISDDLADQCVFLMGDRSGRYYCGIYAARPGDCREFTPIGCQDVDESLSHTRGFKIGPPFQPKRRRTSAGRRSR